MILNAGHIIPVYANVNSQLCHTDGQRDAGWVIPLSQAPTVQFPVSTGQNKDNFVWQLWSDTALVATLPTSMIDYLEDRNNDRAWLQYVGDGNLQSYDQKCGVRHFRFYLSGELIGVSERWKIYTLGDKRKIYKLTFLNSKDLGGVIYQAGYSQHVLLMNAIFDTPEVVEEIEAETDVDNVETVRFQAVKKRLVLKFPYYPDFWFGVFERIASHDYVRLEKMETSEVWDISTARIEVSTEEQDEHFRKGVLRFDEWAVSSNACEQNISPIYVNGALIETISGN